jgi:hypothetical protein
VEIISNLTQKELDYLVEFVENDNIKDWNKAKHDLKSDMHKDSIRKSWNVGKYSGYSVYKFMQDKLEKGFTSDEEYIRLEKLRDQEYKERVRLQDANREKRAVLRECARVEAIQEYIEKKLDEREPKPFVKCEYKIKDGNEASLLVSDLHCGATVDSIFNYYDIDVLRERMNELADKTISFCHKQDVNTLHIEFIGDFITGTIHGSTIAQAQEDIIDQIFDASDIIVEFILLLKQEIPNIKTYFTYGNHGRTTQGKSDAANKSNYERIIPTYVRKELRKNGIKVIDSGYEDFIVYKLKDGKVIVCSHGTNDNPTTANKTFTKLLGEDIFDVHLGHFHSVKEGNGTTVNGSIIGSDDYSISKRLHNKPQQVLKVYYGEDVGTFKLTLK